VYSGPPALTVARAFTSWTLDLPVLVAAVVVGGAYLAGVHRARRRGQPWPPGRVAAFGGGGLGVAVLATMSFVGRYAGVLFWDRAVQTVLLMLVVPLFLALGRPLSLAITAWPGLRPPAERLLASRAARALTFPAVTAPLLVLVPFLLYFTPWYAASLPPGPVAELTRLTLILPGLVFFWTLLRVDPVPKAYPYLVSLWVSVVEVVGDAVLGLAVLADQHLIAGSYYRALARPWGPSLHTDQVFGGGALWLLGDLVGLPFLGAQLIQMIREDQREAAAMDAELDAAEQAAGQAAAGQAAAGQAAAGQAAAGQAAEQAAAGQAPAPGRSRPWWETDPRFTGRFRPSGR
jgi:cytochrome c oxidase assembly factor CtaG